MNVKNTHKEFQSLSLFEFGYYLYEHHRPPKEILQIPAESLYEQSQQKIIQSSFKRVPTFKTEPEPIPPKVTSSSGYIYQINPYKSRRAIIDSGFSCEYDKSHESFIRKNNENKYTEAHHLIPRQFQYKFKYSLDVTANIVSLCSNCHNWLHYGKDIELILRRLYDDRIDKLREVELNVSFEVLLSYYK